MIENIVISAISVAGTALGVYFKTRGDARKNEAKISKVVADRLQGVENKIIKVGMGVDDVNAKVDLLKSDTDFRNILKNSIRSEAARIVDISLGLELEYKNILMYWAKQIEDIALKFYYSPYRNNSEQMDKYLSVDIDSRLSMVNHYIEHIITTPKFFNSKKIFFSEFLIKAQAYRQLELLKIRLVANGIKKDEVASIFMSYVDKFFKDIIGATIVWKTLNDI